MLWVGMQEKLGDCVTRHFGDNVVFVDVRHYAKRLLILFELDDKNKLITKEKKERSKIRRKRKGKKGKKKKKQVQCNPSSLVQFFYYYYTVNIVLVLADYENSQRWPSD